MSQYTKIEYLDRGGRFTCVVLSGDEIVYTSTEKGVKPLKDFYEEYGPSKELTVIDRIMGKGAVMLAQLVGATTIITPMISSAALEYAKRKNIKAFYDREVDYIINRAKDGRCPIETAVLEINDCQEGYKVIDKTLKDLRLKNKGGN